MSVTSAPVSVPGSGCGPSDQRLLEVRLACPDITRACDLARNFADLVRHQRGYLLLEWIRQ
ncbi:hypothetical protein ABT160_44340, partial [Streptomyces sp. NPDC001941]|uniref:hypothetical protein n=1 Tax=Streptomyces sp. NPDC001941 TaxID=3154659 RepID=UPI0033181DD1